MAKKKSSSSGIVFSTDPSFRLPDEVGEEQDTPDPSKQRLKIRYETKHRGGKAVTLIRNFVGKNDDLEELGKRIKTFCGTGGSVKDAQIIIQGDQREKVTGWLKKNGFGLG